MLRVGPVTICPWRTWRYMWLSRNYCGLFRNSKQVRPGRWGFYIIGFEFGSRNPGNKFGVWLKQRGIWRW